MSLVINHNMMAMNTARNLNNTYGRLSSSVEKLSSGLRINSAADDAAGLAIRELMRADIATMRQGIRNAADAISMIQTADGGMAVIDEKLTRMKELAEQAATGTYTTLQREIINSEYQAMAAEIDRIATATNFNGVKLLDGSITNLHGGLGMKIHFGVGNNADEDYYFINTGDVRATSSTGLRIGGDAKNDIWGQGAAGAKGLAGPGCCTSGYDSLDKPAGFISGQTFSYGYNWDWIEDDDPDLLAGKYLAGRYTVNASDSLQDLIDKVNRGTQSRVGVQLDSTALADAIKTGGTAAVCVGEEAYIFGSASIAGGTVTEPAVPAQVYKHLAEGEYVGLNFQYNATNGFGLTTDQINKLKDAGIDLTSLDLASAKVSGSTSSLVSSSQAKSMLVYKLAAAWQALGLSSMSGLSVTSGVNDAFTISAGAIVASANGALVGTGLTATVASGETLNVHTGVYADENGNWTDDRRIASALGFSEVVFHVTNTNVPTYSYTTAYASPTYAMSATNPQLLVTNIQNALTAGVDLKAVLGVASATLTLITGEGATPPEATADLLAKIQAAWNTAYPGPFDTPLDFSTGTAFGTPTLDQAAVEAGNESKIVSDAIDTGETINVKIPNIYVDANGNWTSSITVVDLFKNTTNEFEQLSYEFTEDNGDANYRLLRGTTEIANGTINSTVDTDDLATWINTNVLTEFTTFQGTTVATGEGRFFLNPATGTTPVPPTAGEVDPIKGTVTQSTPTTLKVTYDLAGAVNNAVPTTSPLHGLPRTSTTVQDLISKVADGLTALLESTQLAAVAAEPSLKDLGRVVIAPTTAPAAPSGPAALTGLTVTSSFHSGVLDRSVATGSYDDDGYVFNSATGYGLTSAQLSALTAAGVDLSKLLLGSAIVSSSVSSTVSSAEARTLLLDTLAQMWTALNLGSLSAIVSQSGVTTGFDPLDAAAVTASADPAANILNGTGGTATINNQKELVVHTGVYADAKGNWTTDKDLADDLGLTEVLYTIANNRRSWWTNEATFKSPDYLVSGSLTMTSATAAALADMGVTLPAGAFASASITAFGSAGTSAAASASLLADCHSNWAATYGTYGTFGTVTLTAGDNGSGILPLTTDELVTMAGAGVLSGSQPTATIKPGQKLIVDTGIWVDGEGNWTDDQDIATAFGFEKVTIEYENTGGNYGVDVLVAGGSVGTTTISSTTDLTGLSSDARTSLLAVISGRQTSSSATPGRFAKIPGGPTAPTAAELAAANPTRTKNTDNQVNPAGHKDDLTAFITLSGAKTQVFCDNPPGWLNIDDTDMNDLASLINADLTRALNGAQIAYSNGLLGSFNGIGRLSKDSPQPPNGPTAESDIDDLATVDHYKEASGEKTVSKTGIVDKTKHVTVVASAGTDYLNASGISNFGAWALASAINHNERSQFWAMIQKTDSAGNPADMVYIFAKEGGDNNGLLACDVADGDIASQAALQAIQFENVEGGQVTQDGTNFSLGGQEWGKFRPIQTKSGYGNEVWNLTLHGQDVGSQRDLWIAAFANGANELDTPGVTAGIINGLDRYSFVEIQNAADGEWTGAEVRTQSSAQEALDAVNKAMERKDKVRADIGALQNRLENTITNLEIQVESLQASESRISDVDVATEMTEFVRNQVLAQAAVSMLSQANSLPQMALSLLNG